MPLEGFDFSERAKVEMLYLVTSPEHFGDVTGAFEPAEPFKPLTPDPFGCDLGLGYRFYSALSDMVHLCCARRGVVVVETFFSDSSAGSSSRWVITSRSLWVLRIK